MSGNVRVNWNEAADGSALADRLASTVADRLAAAIATRGGATLAVSGGTTPKLFFQALSKAGLDWERVTVTLVDERFVGPDAPRSNQRLVAENLLHGPAAAARFVPLFREADNIEETAKASAKALSGLAWPLDVVVLGMGTDGHTASFFPDARELDALLDPSTDDIVRSVDAQSAGEPRLTLTMPRLAEAGLLVLHIEGPTKRQVIDDALAGRTDPPIRIVLEHARHPAEIFWAP